MLKKTFELILFVFAALTSIYLLSFGLENFIALYNYKLESQSLFNNDGLVNYSNNDLYLFLILTSLGIFFIAKNKLILGPLMVITFCYQLYVQDSENVRLEVMKERYAKILNYSPLYKNTENSKKLEQAIKDNNPNLFIKVLENINENKQVTKFELNNILEITVNIYPENKELLKNYLKDNYITYKEYNDLKYKAIKNLDFKKLNSEQVALLGVLKWKLKYFFL